MRVIKMIIFSDSHLSASIWPVLAEKNARIGRKGIHHMKMIIIAASLLTLSASVAVAQTCNQIGNQVLCSDGSSATVIGNQTIYSNGVVDTQIGNQTIGSDGLNSTRIGNSTLYNDGTSAQQIGNQTIFSTGQNCQTIGTQYICN